MNADPEVLEFIRRERRNDQERQANFLPRVQKFVVPQRLYDKLLLHTQEMNDALGTHVYQPPGEPLTFRGILIEAGDVEQAEAR